jgi:hypothetical protein
LFCFEKSVSIFVFRFRKMKYYQIIHLFSLLFWLHWLLYFFGDTCLKRRNEHLKRLRWIFVEFNKKQNCFFSFVKICDKTTWVCNPPRTKKNAFFQFIYLSFNTLN